MPTRLQPGDRFVLDGRAFEVEKMDGASLTARPSVADAELPRWTSDRQSLSAELARDLAWFREAAGRLLIEGGSALRSWLIEHHGLDPQVAEILEELLEAQDALSEIPHAGGLLVEESPANGGFSYAFHVPLARSASEALGRAVERGWDDDLAAIYR